MFKKYKTNKIQKVLDKNFIYLMTDFYQMQTDLFNKLYNIFKDFEKSYIIIFLLSLNYKKKNKEFNYNLDYIKKKISVIEISKKLFLSKESTRRKLLELSKINIIIKNNKDYSINFNSSEINKIYEIQNELSSKFISKFSFFFKKNEFFGKLYSTDEIKKYFNKDISYHFYLFLKFQIHYYSVYKPHVPDFDIIPILHLIILNNTYYVKKNKLKESKISFLSNFKKVHLSHDDNGLNATTISELSGIPRASVLRKIKFLLKEKIIKKNLKNLYYLGNLYNSNFAKKYIVNGVPKVLKFLADYLSSNYIKFK